MSPGAPALEGPEALERYLEELRSWGDRINLVGSTDPAALDRHVSDSLAAAPALPSGARVVDLGSGAGFPGLPIALTRPDISMTLVDAREKRVNFLRHVVRTLGLDRVKVQRKRVESPAKVRYDYALLRAVAPAPQSLALALPWLEPTGEAWLWTSAATPPPAPPVATIPLPSGGQILRLPALSRGTPPSP